MGRLIDADALIEAMRKTEEEFENAMTCPSWWSAYRVIEEQPTAYDVETKVAELEKYMDDAMMWDEDDFYDGKARAYECAISIVRGKE